jgi:hypothetical protein
VFRVTDSTLTDTARVTTGLQENVRYYWRVRAKNPTGWGAYSPTWTFGWYLDAVAGASELPRKFALHQNYPNPFNSSTLIGFEVPDVGSQASVVSSQWSEASWITLGIYDILGREVAVLVDQKKAPGRYEARWDAGKCPSGVYVYRMTAGAFVQTRKMILLR